MYIPSPGGRFRISNSRSQGLDYKYIAHNKQLSPKLMW